MDFLCNLPRKDNGLRIVYGLWQYLFHLLENIIPLYWKTTHRSPLNEVDHECENVKTPACFHREDNLVMPSAPRKLTQAQLYTINQIKENKERTTKYRYLGPTSADLMAKIPVLYDDNDKTNKFPTLIEFTGALNVNKRVYFGPVDITRMRILLLDDKGNMLNLNNMDWSFSLISEHLYQY